MQKDVVVKIAKIFKRVAITATVIVLGAVAWFVVNSFDSPTIEHPGFSPKVSELADGENGYFRLRGLGQGANTSKKYDLTSDKLKSFANQNEWDLEWAQKAVAHYNDSIASIEDAVRYENFKLPVTDEPYALPPYQPLVKLNIQALLKSLLLSRQGKYDEAISVLESALQFSQRVKMDKNDYLISYLVGLAMQYDGITQVHHLVGDPNLTADQLKRIAELLQAIPGYKEDRFENVFYGEYRFVNKYIDDFKELDFAQRWQEYINNEDLMAVNELIKSEVGFSLSREIYRIMLVIAPNFYLHKNRSLNNIAAYYEGYQNKVKDYCINTPAKASDYDWSAPSTWRDLITPNALGVNPDTPKAEFDEYLIRRCFAFAHLEAVKTIVAAKRYKLQNNDYPAALDQLVPEYLPVLPVDPFNGGVLGFGKNNLWLTSVGRDHIFNEKSGFYHKDCYTDEACANEPVFLFDAGLMAAGVE